MRLPPARAPDPLTEEPPADRYCDLVLNGGVASGVVYPWALLELARHYRFKGIGGNSVGAIAASVAAAAEYGRCHGVAEAFEPLRRIPVQLAEETEPGGAKMLRLFQPTASVRRLFELFLVGVHATETARGRVAAAFVAAAAMRLYRLWPVLVAALSLGLVGLLWRGAGIDAGPATMVALASVAAAWLADALPPRGTRKQRRAAALRQARWWVRLVAAALLAWVLALGLYLIREPGAWLLALLGVVGAVAATAVVGLCRLLGDLRALAGNGYGLCSGRSQVAGEEALVEWLHKGIQLSAGRRREDAPLTFADLWSAPRAGRKGPAPKPGGLRPDGPGIDLQMFASNVTLGRPVRLPLNDPNTRLYFRSSEWLAYFPRHLVRHLRRASMPYAPASGSDPPVVEERQGARVQNKLRAQLRELPSGGMPIVVAARLSLCFPVLFSCVPVYAVDYETKPRQLRRCLLSDGGLCTNFPIHLFDAAIPARPTFGFLLDQRLQPHNDQRLWLPKTHLEGRADNWMRFVPGAEADPSRTPPIAGLLGLVGGIVLTMKDWNDRMTGRLPQVRNRVIRVRLKAGEGQLNIAMPGTRILRMAHSYGTEAGWMLVGRYAPRPDGEASPAWREHLYVRLMVELRGLRKHLRNFTAVAGARGDTLPMRELLQAATTRRPLAERTGHPDPIGRRLVTSEYEALLHSIDAVSALEAALAANDPASGPYEGAPSPELKLRTPL